MLKNRILNIWHVIPVEKKKKKPKGRKKPNIINKASTKDLKLINLSLDINE